MGRRGAAVLLLLLLASAPASAQEKGAVGERFVAADGAWSLEVPSGWAELTTDPPDPALLRGWGRLGAGGETEIDLLVYRETDFWLANEEDLPLFAASVRRGLRAERLLDCRLSSIRGVPVIRAEVEADGGARGRTVSWLAPTTGGTFLFRIQVHRGDAEQDRELAERIAGSILFRDPSLRSLPPTIPRWLGIGFAALVGVLFLLLVPRGIRRDLRAAREAAAAAPPGPDGSLACGNCGAPVPGAFCGTCGQRRLRGRLDLRTLLSDWLAKVLDWEHGVLGTIRGLTLRPGATIREYVGGRRASYTSPARYFMAWFVIYALVHDPQGGSGARLAENIDLIREALPATLSRSEMEQAARQWHVLERYLFNVLVLPLGVWVSLRLFRRTAWNGAEHLAALAYASGHSLILQSLGEGLAAVGVGGAEDPLAWASSAYLVFALAAVHAPTHGRWGATWRSAVVLLGATMLIGWGFVLWLFGAELLRG